MSCATIPRALRPLQQGLEAALGGGRQQLLHRQSEALQREPEIQDEAEQQGRSVGPARMGVSRYDAVDEDEGLDALSLITQLLG